MSWAIDYRVRPADPDDRRGYPDAHEVRMFDDARPIRTVGVWETQDAADEAAMALNALSVEQIR